MIRIITSISPMDMVRLLGPGGGVSAPAFREDKRRAPLRFLTAR
jgi:hypothetical protein